MVLNYFIWDASPNLLKIGSFVIKWYSMLFALGFVIGRQLLGYIFQQEKKSLNDVDILVTYMILATVIGARLGHVLFYDFAYFSQHPLEIFLPVVFNPTFRFVGYQGLASHGAAISIIIALYIYINYVINISFKPLKLTIRRQQRVGQTYLWVIDRIIIVIALAGSLIRVGNFMNSEIFGKPTQTKTGVLFARDLTDNIKASNSSIKDVNIIKNNEASSNTLGYQPVILQIVFKHSNFEEAGLKNFLEKKIKAMLVHDYSSNMHIYEEVEQPLSYTLSINKKRAYVAEIHTFGILRHPAQLYEAFSCLILFVLLFYRWHKKKSSLQPGELVGVFLYCCIWPTYFL